MFVCQIEMARRYVAVVSVAATTLLLVGCATPDQFGSEPWGPAHPAYSQASAETEAFAHHYIRTLESGDSQAIRGLFVADDRFAWFTDGAQSYATPDDVLQGMGKYTSIRFETTLSNVRAIPVSPMLASVRSMFQTRLTMPGGGTHKYGGVITMLLEKGPVSDTWKIISGHTSTPGGPPQGVQATDNAA